MSSDINGDELTFNEMDNFVNKVIDELVAKYGKKLMIKHYIYFACNIEFKIKALMFKDVLPNLWRTQIYNEDRKSDFYV
jgi:hypothetical protein